MIFIPGRTVWIILMLIAILSIVLSDWMGKNNIPYKIRSIGAISAVDEAIARCAEMGRPALVSLGKRNVRHRDSVAAIPLLSHVATKCAELGAELITGVCAPDWQPLAEAIVEEAYRTAGHAEEYNPENVRFISPKGYAYATGLLGIVNREKVATTFLFGGYGGEQLIISEGSGALGSMVLSVNAIHSQTYALMLSADYACIGEEGYAASAYLGDEGQRINLLASDVMKGISLVYSVLGIILSYAGVL